MCSVIAVFNSASKTWFFMIASKISSSVIVACPFWLWYVLCARGTWFILHDYGSLHQVGSHSLYLARSEGVVHSLTNWLARNGMVHPCQPWLAPNHWFIL